MVVDRASAVREASGIDTTFARDGGRARNQLRCARRPPQLRLPAPHDAVRPLEVRWRSARARAQAHSPLPRRTLLSRAPPPDHEDPPACGARPERTNRAGAARGPWSEVAPCGNTFHAPMRPERSVSRAEHQARRRDRRTATRRRSARPGPAAAVETARPHAREPAERAREHRAVPRLRERGDDAAGGRQRRPSVPSTRARPGCRRTTRVRRGSAAKR